MIDSKDSFNYLEKVWVVSSKQALVHISLINLYNFQQLTQSCYWVLPSQDKVSWGTIEGWEVDLYHELLLLGNGTIWCLGLDLALEFVQLG